MKTCWYDCGASGADLIDLLSYYSAGFRFGPAFYAELWSNNLHDLGQKKGLIIAAPCAKGKKSYQSLLRLPGTASERPLRLSSATENCFVPQHRRSPRSRTSTNIREPQAAHNRSTMFSMVVSASWWGLPVCYLVLFTNKNPYRNGGRDDVGGAFVGYTRRTTF